jgi:hypothetical protein
MNPITAAHLHLLLSHVPVTVILMGAGWLAFGLWRQSREVQKAALAMFVVAALLAVPSYLTGEPASGAIKGMPGFSDRVLESHQAAAGVALGGCIALGIAALAGLVHYRGRTVVAWFSLLVLVGAIAVGGLVAWTAHLGGQIRHSEIRLEEAPE